MSTKQLHQMIYVSTPKKDITYQEIEEVNQSCVKSSKELNITGLLLYTGNKFIEVIEGERKDIDHLFTSEIEPNPLHDSIKLLSNEKIQHRCFEKWSMNYFILEESFFDAHPFITRKYQQHFEQGTLYKDKYLIFSLLYDIYTSVEI